MQKNSTYFKIKEILRTAENYSSDISSFEETLQNNNDSFIYYKRVNDRVIEEPCSRKSIRKNVAFCIDLGLINNYETCALTNNGQEALEPEKFDSVLRRCILEYFEANNLSWPTIENTINRIDYPTPLHVFRQLSPTINEDIFRRCLYLLSLCGKNEGQNILHEYIRKTYLTDEKYQEIRNV